MPVISAAEAMNSGAPIKTLIYAPSGTGKTYLSATSPDPLFLLTERQSIPSIAASNPKAKIVYVETADELRKYITEAMRKGTIEGAKFETLVLDSLTEAQRMIRDEIENNPKRKGSGHEGLTRQEWGILADKTRSLVRALRNLPFNVVCTALMNDSIDDQDVRRIVPLFQGQKTGHEIPQWFTIIGALTRSVSKDEDGNKLVARRIIFDSSANVLSKVTEPLEGVIINPNLSDIFSQIRNHQKK